MDAAGEVLLVTAEELQASGSETANSYAYASMALLLLRIGIALWFFIEFFFFKGTQGPNRFGPDPLGTKAADANFTTQAQPTSGSTKPSYAATDKFLSNSEPRNPRDGVIPYLKWLFGSFQGRIRLREMWFGHIGFFVLFSIVSGVVFATAGDAKPDVDQARDLGSSYLDMFSLLVFPFGCPCLG